MATKMKGEYIALPVAMFEIIEEDIKAMYKIAEILEAFIY